MMPAVRSLSRCDHRLPGRVPSASQHQLQSTGGAPPAMAIPVSGSRISLGCLRMVIRTCLWGAIEHSPRVPSLYMSRSLRDAVFRSLPSRPTLSTVAVGRRPVCGPTPGRFRAKLMDFSGEQVHSNRLPSSIYATKRTFQRSRHATVRHCSWNL